MPRFLNNIDLTGNQLLNHRLQMLASDPASTEALIYYNTTAHVVRYYNGTAWVDLVASPSDVLYLGGQPGSYYLDRSNHTGIQLAASISDLASTVLGYRLDQFAAPTGPVAMNSQRLTGLADPTNAQDAATKAYVDAVGQGLRDVKDSVRLASTANRTVSGLGTLDTITLTAGMRVLLKDQTNPAENGIWITASGSWSRAADADSSDEVTPGMFVFVEEGATNADTGWVLTTDAPITLGTTGLTFAQFSGAGTILASTGLIKIGNTIALDTASGYGVRKVALDLGDGSATAITVTHNFGTRDVDVTIRNNASPYDKVYPDIEMATTNTVTIRFATAPSNGQFRAIVTG